MNGITALITVAAAAFSGLLVAVALGAIAGLFVMWLWNLAVFGTIPGVPEIGYFNAWGLYLLCAILFKSTSRKEKEDK
jgi:hypothetical protein